MTTAAKVFLWISLAGIAFPAANDGPEKIQTEQKNSASQQSSNNDKSGLKFINKVLDMTHTHERRGRLQVPLDYNQPDGMQLQIFYRYMPAKGKSIDDHSIPTIIVINGGPGSSSAFMRSYDFNYAHYGEGEWERLNGLGEHFHLLILDQRGTDGYSTAIDLDYPQTDAKLIAEHFDAKHIARDYLQVIRALLPKEAPIILLGQSFGAAVAFQYLDLQNNDRFPNGMIITSGILPHTDMHKVWLHRRQEQRQLNLQLKAAYPDVTHQITKARSHFNELGIDPNAINHLWGKLGHGNKGEWEQQMYTEIMRLQNLSKDDILTFIVENTGTVNLLNYVLSSSVLTPNHTDRTLALALRKAVILEDWMLDESWAITQIGLEGWQRGFIDSIDKNPPPAMQFSSLPEIRKQLNRTQTLFTFGEGDAFLPSSIQYPYAQQYKIKGHTQFKILPGGHGAAFLPDGVNLIREWIYKRIIAKQ